MVPRNRNGERKKGLRRIVANRGGVSKNDMVGKEGRESWMEGD